MGTITLPQTISETRGWAAPSLDKVADETRGWAAPVPSSGGKKE